MKIGSFVEVNAPFASDAYRIENGMISAGSGCSRAGCENIKTQTIMKHPAITTRVAAADEDLGIVPLRMNFGDTGSYGQGNALIVWEAFKVYGGQIHAVEGLHARDAGERRFRLGLGRGRLRLPGFGLLVTRAFQHRQSRIFRKRWTRRRQPAQVEDAPAVRANDAGVLAIEAQPHRFLIRVARMAKLWHD